MTLCHILGAEVQFDSLLTSALNGDNRRHTPEGLIPGKPPGPVE